MNSDTDRPEGLQHNGGRLWDAVAGGYDLRPDERVVLGQACRTLDTIDAMQNRLGDDSPVVAGSRGHPRPHPLLGEIREHRALLARLLRQLGLPDPDDRVDTDTAPAGGLSPATQRAMKAARARWSRHGP